MIAPAVGEPLAQLVEHLTFNQRVGGSKPPRLTRTHCRCDVLTISIIGIIVPLALQRPHRLVVRTLAFHAGNTGSIPVGVAKRDKPPLRAVFLYRMSVHIREGGTYGDQ